MAPGAAFASDGRGQALASAVLHARRTSRAMAQPLTDIHQPCPPIRRLLTTDELIATLAADADPSPAVRP